MKRIGTYKLAGRLADIEVRAIEYFRRLLVEHEYRPGLSVRGNTM